MANRKTAKKKARLERKRLEAMGLPLERAINIQQSIEIKKIIDDKPKPYFKQSDLRRPIPPTKFTKGVEIKFEKVDIPEEKFDIDKELDKAIERRLGKR